MANQYDTNLKLQAIADAIGDSQSSGLISALEDIADAVAGGGGGGSSAAGLVSDNFSETDTYDLGDFCIHNNTLYVCINAINTPGPWDLSDWQATNAGIQLSSLNSALNGKSLYYDQVLSSSGTFADINIDLTGYRYFMVVQEYNSTSMAIGFIYNIVGLASDEASNVAWSNNTLYSIGISMKIVSTSKMQLRLNSIGYGALTPNKTRIIGFK